MTSLDNLTDVTYQTGGPDNLIIGQKVTLTAGATQNVFIGELAGATAAHSTSGTIQNTAVGYQALEALTSGFENTAVGYLALAANNAGAGNVAVGATALSSNTSGIGNMAIGVALPANISGNENMAMGSGALLMNTTGSTNVAIGGGALTNLNGSDNNIAIGQITLGSLASGSGNIGIGCLTFEQRVSGNNNIAIGFSCGSTPSVSPTGSNNILIGANVDVPTPSTSNYLNIGDAITGDMTTGPALMDGFTATTQTAGDNSTKVATTAYVDAAVAAVPTGPFTSEFISTTLTLPGLDTEVSVAHGLGGKPKLIRVVLICTSADQGYSVDDELDMIGTGAAGVFAGNVGAVISSDATNVNVSTLPNGTSPFVGILKGGSSGGSTYFTSASWGMKVYAWM